MAAPVSEQYSNFTQGEFVRGVAVAAGTTIASLTVDIPLMPGLWRLAFFIDATNIATNSLSTVECVPITSLGVVGTAGSGYAMASMGAVAATKVITLGKVLYCEPVMWGSIGLPGIIVDGVVRSAPTGGVRLIITKDVNTTGNYGITYTAIRIG